MDSAEGRAAVDLANGVEHLLEHVGIGHLPAAPGFHAACDPEALGSQTLPSGHHVTIEEL